MLVTSFAGLAIITHPQGSIRHFKIGNIRHIRFF